MREPIRDKGRLEHIIQAIDTITESVKGVSYEDFCQNKILYGAVVYYTMIIGECAYMLSLEFKQNHLDTPWTDIAGMRHHLVHGYYQVNKRDVWDVIENDLQPLRFQIGSYLKEYTEN